MHWKYRVYLQDVQQLQLKDFTTTQKLINPIVVVLSQSKSDAFMLRFKRRILIWELPYNYISMISFTDIIMKIMIAPLKQ